MISRNPVKNQVRRATQDNPGLYRIWFRWYVKRYRKERALPKRGDALYLDGFPRSGNTYFSAAFRTFFPEVTIRDHFHCVAPLKIALSQGVPSVILIRDPIECILSRLVQITEASPEISPAVVELYLKELIDDWVAYYSYCKRNLNSIELIVFEKSISDPHPVVLSIFQTLLDAECQLSSSQFAEFDASFKKRDQTKPQGSTSAPDANRQRQKDRFRALLYQQNGLEEAKSLYQDIVSASVERPSNEMVSEI